MAKLWIFVLVACLCFVKLCFADASEESKVPLVNFGPNAGDSVIESYEAATKVPLGVNITYFGSSYDSIFISKDGFVGFTDKIRYLEGVQWSEGIRNAAADRPFMAPFYHDGYDPTTLGPDTYQGKIYYQVVDARYLESEEGKKSRHYDNQVELLNYFNNYVQEAVINAPYNFSTEVAVIVTWADVTDAESAKDDECDAHIKGEKCKSATFQAVIIADKDNTFAMFNYLEMGIPYQESYQAGFNGGFQRGWLNVIPCLAGCKISGGKGERMNPSQVNQLHNLKGSDFEGRYFLNVGGETIVRGGCLPTDIGAGMLEVFPREVGMFGGEKLEVSGKCLKMGHKIHCRFGEGTDTFQTEGVMTNDMKGYCPVPIMSIRGSVKMSWSSDGKTWSASRDIAVVVPWMVEDVKFDIRDPQIFNFYKQKVSDSYTLKWSAERMSREADARVEVKLIGYRETDKEVEYKELENLGEARNSDGSFTFRTADHSCKKNCEDFETGLLEVGLKKEHYGDASNRVAVRFGPIPLRWYVNKKLSDSMGKNWSKDVCRRWYDREDKRDKTWMKELPKCPCNLDQAIADFGRWQAHPSCDVTSGEGCIFQQAIHCVVSGTPTSSGAGNVCCYRRDKTLIYTQLAFNVGAPSRSHLLGVHPYNQPGRVPGMSYVVNDLMPYFQCCFWMEDDSDLCHHFTKLRPTPVCTEYEAPGLGFVRGDPHVTTFDGNTYHFGGMGDFWLVDLPDISIQGRFKPRRGSWDLGSLNQMGKWQPTALTQVSLQGSGVPIQVYVAPELSVRKRGLDILIEKERHFFYTTSTKWQEFGGMTVMNNAQSMDDNPHNNFTIITNNVGINVVALNNLLHVTVALPPSMKSKGPSAKGMGLLGVYDGNPDNDFVSSDGKLEASDVDPMGLSKNFSMTWDVDKTHSLVPIAMPASQHSDYKQYFSFHDIPHDFDGAPSESQINETCKEDMSCKWDYRVTGSQKIAMATKDANDLFSHRQSSVSAVENCGLPAIGDMAILSSNDFSVGAKDVEVSGCYGDHKFVGKVTFKCVKERLDDAQAKDNGHIVTDEDNIKHIIHWTPNPYTVCEESPEDKRQVSDSDDSDSGSVSTGMIVGIVIAVIVVIIIIVVVVRFLRKKNNAGSEDIQEPGVQDPMMKKQEGAISSAV